MYFIEINDNKITCKGIGEFKTDEQIDITEEIYNQLTRLPADFTLDTEGNIETITPALEPEPETLPVSIEERVSDLELLVLQLGGVI